MNAPPRAPVITQEADVVPFSLPALHPPHVPWPAHRATALDLAAQHIYGRLPTTPPDLTPTLVHDAPFASAPGHLHQWQVHLRAGPAALTTDLALISPPAAAAHPAARVPVVLLLNFHGNHTIATDPALRLPAGWVPTDPRLATATHRADPRDRGRFAHRFPCELILARGVAVATAYCGDFVPDHPDFYPSPTGAWPLLAALGATATDPARPGALAAWAWGLSRLLDALAATAPWLDLTRAAVLGHSRLGKAALWAGALDDRFAVVAVNESGCGGAALARRRFGERLVHINTQFPHWFCPRHHTYNEREEALPLDQPHVLALIAPRLLHLGSAAEDLWADPYGEYLALAAAAPAWGHITLPSPWPAPGEVVRTPHLAYHLRPGPHDLRAADWSHYLDTLAAAAACPPP